MFDKSYNLCSHYFGAYYVLSFIYISLHLGLLCERIEKCLRWHKFSVSVPVEEVNMTVKFVQVSLFAVVSKLNSVLFISVIFAVS